MAFLANTIQHRSGSSTPKMLDTDYSGAPDPMLSIISLLVQSSKKLLSGNSIPTIFDTDYSGAPDLMLSITSLLVQSSV